MLIPSGESAEDSLPHTGRCRALCTSHRTVHPVSSGDVRQSSMASRPDAVAVASSSTARERYPVEHSFRRICSDAPAIASASGNAVRIPSVSSEPAHERAHHDHGECPGAIRRADHFDGIFEHRRRAEKSARMMPCDPAILRQRADVFVESGEVFVEAETGARGS